MKKIITLVMVSMLILSGCAKAENKNEGKGKEKIKIGVLEFIEHPSLDAATKGFIDELKNENLDVEIVKKSASGDISLLSTLTKSLESEGVDLIYAVSTPSAQGAKSVTKDIPIVFSCVTDPVSAGLVNSLDKPDGNITGVSDYVSSEEQVNNFLKIYKDIKTFGVIYNTSESNSEVQVNELEKVLKSKNIELEKVGVNNVNDISQAISSLSTKIDALFALTDNLVANAAPVVSEKLIELNIPSLSAEEGQVKNGLLISEGVNYYKHGVQAGQIASKILKGEDIKNIPVECNKASRKVVNESTAKALGLSLDDEIFKNAEIIK